MQHYQDNSHKEAVLESSKGNIDKTFDIHKENIKESGNKEVLVAASVRLYLEKNLKQRENTLLISPTRNLRDKINNRIRVGLRADKELKGEIHAFTALRQKDMTIADYSFAPSFNKDDVIKFNTRYKNGINKGDYLRVKSISEISNSLILDKNGKEIIFHLKKNVDYENKFEVFKDIKLRLQEGLKIIFTKNNKDYGLINSETAVIQQIDKKNILMKFEDGKVKSIPKNQLKHMDYGYCVTVHTSQGKTFDNTIAAISNNKVLNNQKSWLVSLSRHRNEFTALVENKNTLKTYLMKNKGTEISAIEFQEKIGSNQAKNDENTLQNKPVHGKINKNKEIQSVI